MDALSDIGQVSTLSIAFITSSLILCAITLVGVCIWGKRNYRVLFSFFSVFAGVAGYFTTLLVLGGLGSLASQINVNTWVFVIAYALVSALVAELTRFGIFFVMKDRRDFPDGLAFGIGYGGTELILSVGLTLAAYYMFSVSIINAGNWGSLVQEAAKTSQAEADYYIQLGQMLVQKAPFEYIVVAVDGLCKLLVQIALSLTVLLGYVKGRKWQYLSVAVMIHMVVAILYVLPQLLPINQWVLESVVLVLAVASVLYIVKTGRKWSFGTTEKDALSKPKEQENDS
jgi:uncharacterized membrane protein YhfC